MPYEYPTTGKVMTSVQNVDVELSADQKQAVVHFSHLSYDDFGRTERIEHWKLARVFESGRYYGIQRGVVDLDKVINRQAGCYVLGVQYAYHPDLWKVRRGHVFPYKLTMEVVDMGRTSVTFFSRLVNKLDGRELATSLCKVVYVQRSTGRPVPFPSWLTEKHIPNPKTKQQMELTRTVPQSPPAAYQYSVSVAASDLDANVHANQSSYVRFCCDAAQAAVHDGVLTTFQPDIGNFPLLEQAVVYLSETAFGDNLKVVLWQQGDKKDTLQFVIRREKSQPQPDVVFHSTMKFGLTPSFERVPLKHPRL